MKTVSNVKRTWLILSIAVLSAAATPGFAGERWPSVVVNATKETQKIYAALQEPTQIEFIETPLQDALTFLRDQHDIRIVLDKKSLDDIGVSTDVPVTKRINGLSLHSALNLLLDDLDLTFAVWSESLLITVPARAETLLEVRIYNVQPLIGENEDSSALLTAIATALDFHSPAASGGGIFAVNDQFGGMAAPPTRANLRRLVAYRSLLIVRDSFQHQEQLASFLAAMQSAMHADPPATNPQAAAD